MPKESLTASQAQQTMIALMSDMGGVRARPLKRPAFQVDANEPPKHGMIFREFEEFRQAAKVNASRRLASCLKNGDVAGARDALFGVVSYRWSDNDKRYFLDPNGPHIWDLRPEMPDIALPDKLAMEMARKSNFAPMVITAFAKGYCSTSTAVEAASLLHQGGRVLVSAIAMHSADDGSLFWKRIEQVLPAVESNPELEAKIAHSLSMHMDHGWTPNWLNWVASNVSDSYRGMFFFRIIDRYGDCAVDHPKSAAVALVNTALKYQTYGTELGVLEILNRASQKSKSAFQKARSFFDSRYMNIDTFEFDFSDVHALKTSRSTHLVAIAARVPEVWKSWSEEKLQDVLLTIVANPDHKRPPWVRLAAAILAHGVRLDERRLALLTKFDERQAHKYCEAIELIQANGAVAPTSHGLAGPR